MKIFYSDDYIQSGHEFDTTRKSGWIADSLKSDPIEGVEIVTPGPASEAQIGWAHDPRYIEALKYGTDLRLAESQGFTWDKGLWTAITASTGGVISAAFAALEDGVSGSLSSGLHHARRRSGAGFCSINGLAVAACEVLATKQAARVLILDLDAHAGGGTASIIKDYDGISQGDVSVSDFDSYFPSHSQIQLRGVDRAEDYLDEIDRLLFHFQSTHFDLVLYNAGQDPFEGCDIGGLQGITKDILRQREELVISHFRNRQVPIAWVLAGGYVGRKLSEQELVDLHRLTIEEAAKW